MSDAASDGAPSSIQASGTRGGGLPRLSASPIAWGCLAFVVWSWFATSIASPIVLSDEVLFFITGMSGRDLGAARAMDAAIQDSDALLYPAILNLLAQARLPVETAAKLLNAAAFALATGLAATLARPAGGRRPTWMAGALLALAPIGTYATYIMPESLYYGVFVLLLCLLAREGGGLTAGRLAMAGATAGVLTLLKPHGVIVGISLGLTSLAWAGVRRPGFKATLLPLSALVLAYVAVVALGLWLLSPGGAGGEPALMGERYDGQLKYITGGFSHLLAGLGLTSRYMVGVLLLLAPSIVVLGAGVAAQLRARQDAEGDPLAFAALFAVVTIVLLLVAVPQVVTNEADRIHLRWVSFATLALAPLAIGLAERRQPGRLTLRLAGACWLLSVIAMAAILPSYRPLPVDAPELFFLAASKDSGAAFGPGVGVALLFAIAAAALAVGFGRVSWRAAQLAVLLATAVVSVANVRHIDRVWAASYDPSRRLGQLAAQACPPGRGRLIAVGTYQNFVLLYVPLYVLARPVPLLVEHEAQARAALQSLKSGDCALTTLSEDPTRFSLLGTGDPVKLYRVR